MLKSVLWDCKNAEIFVKGTIRSAGAGADTAARQVNKKKQTLFESFASFNHCLNEIDNSQLDNAKYSK